MQRRGNSSSSQQARSGEWQIPPLPLIAAVGLVGIAVGWLVSQGTIPGPRGEFFDHQPWYVVWSAMGALLVALWLILGYVSLWQIWSLLLVRGGSRRDRLKQIIIPAFGYLLYGVIIAVVAAIQIQRVRGKITSAIPLTHPMLRIAFYTAVAVLASAPSVAGLWVIRRHASSLPAVASDASDAILASLNDFRTFRSAVQRFLAMLSTIIATDVLHLSALRIAVVRPRGLVGEVFFPPEFVLLFGAVFAVAIAIVYLPPELALRQAGRILQDVAVEQLEAGSPKRFGDEIEHWLKHLGHRARVGQALGLEASVLRRVQNSLGIFAPLLTSIIAVFLPR